MPRKLHLAIDLDDVLVDFWPRVVKCYNTEFGEAIGLEAQNDWGDNPIKKSSHFGEGKMFKDWWDWWQSRNLWSDCGVILGAIGGLYNLHAAGHYIEIVTSKPHWARPDMNKWLFEWNPYYDRITVVEEGKDSPKKHEATDADILVDDRPSNVQGWLDDGRRAIVFDRPWNMGIGFDYFPPAEIHRAFDWHEIQKWVKVYSSELELV